MSHTIEAVFKDQKRTINLEVGKKYKIDPMNITKKKNVGRICTLIELDSDFMPSSATVQWQDSGRKGKIDSLSDLVPYLG